MKAFKAGVHGVLRVSAYGCETAGELLCAILRVSGLTVSLQSPGLQSRDFFSSGERLLLHYLRLLCYFTQCVLHGVYEECLD